MLTPPANNAPITTYNNIGGLLLLLATSLIMTILFLLYVIFDGYANTFGAEYWPLVSTPGLPGYIPHITLIASIELTLNCLLCLAWIYCTLLFFRLKRSFPKTYIIALLAAFAVSIYDLTVPHLLYPEELPQPEYQELTRSTIFATLSIVYLCRSKRVKGSFTRS